MRQFLRKYYAIIKHVKIKESNEFVSIYFRLCSWFRLALKNEFPQRIYYKDLMCNVYA